MIIYVLILKHVDDDDFELDAFFKDYPTKEKAIAYFKEKINEVEYWRTQIDWTDLDLIEIEKRPGLSGFGTQFGKMYLSLATRELVE